MGVDIGAYILKMLVVRMDFQFRVYAISGLGRNDQLVFRHQLKHIT